MQDTRFDLRPATPDDLDDVFDLFAEVQAIHATAEPEFFRQPEKDDLFRAFFGRNFENPDHRLVLACVDGTTVGYIQYMMGTQPKDVFRSEGRLAYINQLVVTERYRRTGCATLLIAHVRQEAEKQSIPLLGIDFWSFNGAARACFEKSGFKVNQEIMWLRL